VCFEHGDECSDAVGDGNFLTSLATITFSRGSLNVKLLREFLFELFFYSYIFQQVPYICPARNFYIDRYEIRFQTTDNLLLNVISLSFLKLMMFCEINELFDI
jgi:hypothetical protein